MRIWPAFFPAIILSLFFSCKLFAYPNAVKGPVTLGLAQATGGIAITNDDQYLIIGYAETIKRIDLGPFAATSSQPKAFSETDGTKGTIGGMVFVPSSNSIYFSQDDGDLLNINLDLITSTATNRTLASGKTLSKMVIDTKTSPATIYIANTTDNVIYIYNVGSSTFSGTIDIKSLLPNISFSIRDMVFVPDAGSAGELYISTSVGRVLYSSAGSTSATVIDIDSANSDNLVALDAMPDGTKVYVANEKDKSVEVITTSTHQKGTAISLSDNTSLTDIVVATVTNPSAVYGFVSGQLGVSVFRTLTGEVIDFNTGNTSGTNDPISTTLYGPMIASSDGYIYLSTGGGDLALVTDKPFITVGTSTYTNSAGASATSLGVGGNVTITFKSDTSGTYQLRAGGNITQNGSLLTDTSSATSGSATANTDKSVTIAYNTNSSAFSEGSNNIYIFVTDSSSIVGREVAVISVDTPPSTVTISSTSFGNGRAYVTFSRLTASDISTYRVYADTSSTTVLTKTDISATVSQPSSGTEVTAEVTGLTNGTTYFFAVEAVDSAGNVGARSTAVSATPEATVGPAGLAGEAGGCSLLR